MGQELAKVTKLEQKIANIDTPEEANSIRRQVSAIQKLIGNRNEAFHTAWEGGKTYCEASAKAGAEWDRLDEKRHKGQNKSCQTFYKTISTANVVREVNVQHRRT
jgi:hypothetical protein